MKICFDAHFCTDGDFGFDEDSLSILFEIDRIIKFYNDTLIKYNYINNTDCEMINILLLVEGNKDVCRRIVQKLLESLICSFCTSKYYLVGDLYELFDSFHKDLWKDTNQYKEECLGGNYDGTILTLKMEE